VAKKNQVKLPERTGCDTLLFATDVGGSEIPEWIHVLPMGKATPVDGRRPFHVTDDGLRLVMEERQQLGRDLHCDYHHQSLWAQFTGAEAPAAGWVEQLEVRETGLWAKMEWTDKAKERLAAREFRYLSPVIYTRKKDRVVVGLHSVALTNTPALNQLEPVVNSQQGEDEPMDKKLKEALEAAFGEGLSEEQYAEKLSALAAQKPLGEVAKVVGLSATATSTEICRVVRELQGKHVVSVEEHTALREEVDRLKAERVVDEALSAGKLTPAQKDWAMNYASDDLDGFSSFLKTQGTQVPVGNAQAPQADGEQQALTAEEKEVAELYDLTEEEMLAAKKA